ncbi:long-chain fatty acid transport protein [Mesorhizobium albiziae]|uniref:Long-chain fatty acid transport protein n=1 Tax=Neomesorhizobium albiziae TaxID=335020 RepID=A0A1I3YTB3_9HYPH|nr:OmpP1/FadL family transporter [Mesorhizobium albiziae]GLS33325.1 long-chain fatty acid transporter [Mesorhizobium albiziae]SFK34471.1 long-chain fatty acid transport protein [Mesorhizobium albiziae]
MNTLFKSLLGAGCAVVAMVGAANAGGLERGGYNIDLLFDPSRFAAEAAATYVMPDRELNNVRDTNPLNGVGATGRGGGQTNGVKDTEDYWVPRIGFKAGIGESVDCLVDYSQPWGAHTNPGRNWAGANDNIETKINSDNYGATCSYKMPVGSGQFRLLGGVFYQEVDGFKERLVVGGVPAALGTGVGRLDLGDSGVGWRVGAAYEIPEIALRASLVYNSSVDLDGLSGTVDLTQIPAIILPPTDPRRAIFGRVTSVFGEATMPEMVELKVQSGIAPDWLAFGSIKWTNWSRLQTVDLCVAGTESIPCVQGGPTFVTSLDLLYRDGWTVSGGVGHKFNDQWSGAANITWDRGTTTGLSSQTDTWTFGGGVAYTPNQSVELRLAGALGIMTSGSAGRVVKDGVSYGNDVAYDFDNDLVSALSAQLKIKW